MPGQPAPSDQVQGVFFKQDSDTCTSEMVSSIEVYINHNVICGIAFVYPSKPRRKLGDIATGEFQSIEVVPGSRISRFSAGITANGIAEVEVQAYFLDLAYLHGYRVTDFLRYSFDSKWMVKRA